MDLDPGRTRLVLVSAMLASGLLVASLVVAPGLGAAPPELGEGRSGIAVAGSAVTEAAATEAGRTGSAALRSAAVARPKLSKVRLRFTRVAKGLREPTDVESARDGTGRLFVAERAGRVRVVRDGKVRKRPYLDLRSRVRSTGGEQGLLSIAFRPGFKKHREVYVAYTTRSNALRVSRFKARSNHRAGRIRKITEQVVLTVPHPGATNHNGGALVFGKRGLLFVSTGDGGGAGDPGNDALRTDSLLGKILRIDVSRRCGSKRYCVPRSNPFVGRADARPEVWAQGLRNPWRFSRDHRTGDLWIGDVGQDRYEEINRMRSRDRGASFGWSCREARSSYDTSRCRSGQVHRDPVFSYPQARGRSVIGGHVYRGKRHARLIGGRYVFTDFFSGNLWLHGRKSGRTVVAGAMPDGAMVTALGETAKREIVAVTYDGGLWRMRARRR